ncbi:unnamed protein product [Amoebophrya sp. A25]|nr:unnamed protein product [Amoebophrya sp. A25]|eukprot:GSA25T00006172001.1
MLGDEEDEVREFGGPLVPPEGGDEGAKLKRLRTGCSADNMQSSVKSPAMTLGLVYAIEIPPIAFMPETPVASPEDDDGDEKAKPDPTKVEPPIPGRELCNKLSMSTAFWGRVAPALHPSKEDVAQNSLLAVAPPPDQQAEGKAGKDGKAGDKQDMYNAAAGDVVMATVLLDESVFTQCGLLKTIDRDVNSRLGGQHTIPAARVSCAMRLMKASNKEFDEKHPMAPLRSYIDAYRPEIPARSGGSNGGFVLPDNFGFTLVQYGKAAMERAGDDEALENRVLATRISTDALVQQFGDLLRIPLSGFAIYETEVNVLKHEVLRWRKLFTDLEQEYKHLHKQYEELEHFCMQLRGELANAKDEIASLQALVAQLQDDNAQLRADIERITEQAGDALRKMAELEEQIKALTKEKAGMMLALDEMRDRLETMERNGPSEGVRQSMRDAGLRSEDIGPIGPATRSSRESSPEQSSKEEGEAARGKKSKKPKIRTVFSRLYNDARDRLTRLQVLQRRFKLAMEEERMRIIHCVEFSSNLNLFPDYLQIDEDLEDVDVLTNFVLENCGASAVSDGRRDEWFKKTQGRPWSSPERHRRKQPISGAPKDEQRNRPASSGGLRLDNQCRASPTENQQVNAVRPSSTKRRLVMSPARGAASNPLAGSPHRLPRDISPTSPRNAFAVPPPAHGAERYFNQPSLRGQVNTVNMDDVVGEGSFQEQHYTAIVHVGGSPVAPNSENPTAPFHAPAVSNPLDPRLSSGRVSGSLLTQQVRSLKGGGGGSPRRDQANARVHSGTRRALQQPPIAELVGPPDGRRKIVAASPGASRPQSGDQRGAAMEQPENSVSASQTLMFYPDEQHVRDFLAQNPSANQLPGYNVVQDKLAAAANMLKIRQQHMRFTDHYSEHAGSSVTRSGSASSSRPASAAHHGYHAVRGSSRGTSRRYSSRRQSHASTAASGPGVPVSRIQKPLPDNLDHQDAVIVVPGVSTTKTDVQSGNRIFFTPKKGNRMDEEVSFSLGPEFTPTGAAQTQADGGGLASSSNRSVSVGGLGNSLPARGAAGSASGLLRSMRRKGAGQVNNDQGNTFSASQSQVHYHASSSTSAVASQILMPSGSQHEVSASSHEHFPSSSFGDATNANQRVRIATYGRQRAGTQAFSVPASAASSRPSTAVTTKSVEQNPSMSSRSASSRMQRRDVASQKQAASAAALLTNNALHDYYIAEAERPPPQPTAVAPVVYNQLQWCQKNSAGVQSSAVASWMPPNQPTKVYTVPSAVNQRRGNATLTGHRIGPTVAQTDLHPAAAAASTNEPLGGRTEHEGGAREGADAEMFFPVVTEPILGLGPLEATGTSTGLLQQRATISTSASSRSMDHRAARRGGENKRTQDNVQPTTASMPPAEITAQTIGVLDSIRRLATYAVEAEVGGTADSEAAPTNANDKGDGGDAI